MFTAWKPNFLPSQFSKTSQKTFKRSFWKTSVFGNISFSTPSPQAVIGLSKTWCTQILQYNSSGQKGSQNSLLWGNALLLEFSASQNTLFIHMIWKNDWQLLVVFCQYFNPSINSICYFNSFIYKQNWLQIERPEWTVREKVLHHRLGKSSCRWNFKETAELFC